VCEAFKFNRLHTAEILKRLGPDAMSRAGVHNQRGVVTLGELVDLYVWHVEHHRGFIERKRAQMGK